MKEIELVDLEYHEGCLTAYLPPNLSDRADNQISLIMATPSLEKAWQCPNQLGGDQLTVKFPDEYIDILKCEQSIGLYLYINQDPYKLVVQSKHLQEKINHASSIAKPNQISLALRNNHLHLVLNQVSEQKGNKRKMVIRRLEFNPLTKSLSFQVKGVSSNNQMKIVLVERTLGTEWCEEIVVAHEDIGGIRVEFSLDNFAECHYNQFSRWDLYLDIGGSSGRQRIGQYDDPVLQKPRRYLTSAKTPGANLLTPYLTIYNGLSVLIAPIHTLNSEKSDVKMKVKKFRMVGSAIKGRVQLIVKDGYSFDVQSVQLKHRNGDKTYSFPVKTIKRRGNRWSIYFEMDIASLSLENYYWDFYLNVEIDNVECSLRFKHPSRLTKILVKRFLWKQSYKYPEGYWAYPYITAVNSVALLYKQINEYDQYIYRVKELFAFVWYLLFKPYYDRKKIWVSYEKFADSAQDNGFYFFKYCYQNNAKKDMYFILREDSPDRINIQGMDDKVLIYMSFKYMVYLMAADLLISSESKSHAYDIRTQKGLMKGILSRKSHVFLQHGVLGFKRVDHIYRKTSRNKVDLFVVSSEFEKDIVVNNFGYKDEEVILTGLSRWDVLQNQAEGSSIILVMPTWRSWMDDVPEERFAETEYFMRYESLLNSKELSTFLSDHQVQLHFFIHPKFKAYINQFHSDDPNIKIYGFGEVNLNQLLMKSNMLVTDYSSVAWDMYYQGKPVVFYQFDYEQYMQLQGSYMDMEKHLFGDRAFTNEELINLMQKYVGCGYQEDEKYRSLRENYFAYKDNNNSERILKEIIKRYS